MKLRNKKTGEIIDGRIEVFFQNNDKFPNPLERHTVESIDELNEEWEDYTPTEPLIKDEKIRKALRAWAEANDTDDGITYLGDGEFRSYLNTTIDFAILVDEHRFDSLESKEIYPITELCGEEEE